MEVWSGAVQEIETKFSKYFESKTKKIEATFFYEAVNAFNAPIAGTFLCRDTFNTDAYDPISVEIVTISVMVDGYTMTELILLPQWRELLKQYKARE